MPPELTVSAPREGQLYRAGDTITYNAFASDAAGFDLNDGDIKTEVRLHHGTHFHPFVGPLTGRAGSFTIPTTGEASADTSYEIKVTATDSNGLSTSKIVNVFPRKSQMSLATSPPGLGLLVDGVPVSTPRTFTGVEGFQRELARADDGRRRRTAPCSSSPAGPTARASGTSSRTPEDDTTYTATYRPSAAVHRQVLRQHDVLGRARADPAGRDDRLRLGRGLARPGPARRQLLRPLDQDAVVRRRAVQVHRLRRRRGPALHRRTSGSSASGRGRRTPSSATSPSSARASTRSRWSSSSAAATRPRR